MPLETKKKPTEEAKRILCVHEAGHAVLGWNEPLMSDVKRVRVWFKQRRGVTSFKGRYISPLTIDDYLTDIAVDLAGCVAERVVLGQWSNLNEGDLSNARNQIEDIVLLHGMSRLGPIHLNKRPMSAGLRHRVDAEIERILKEQLAYAEKRLREPKLRKQLDLVADALMKRKKLKKRDLKKLLGQRPKTTTPRPKKTNARRKT